RAPQFKLVIFNYVAKDSELCKHKLSPPKWAALELVLKWLKAFRSATTEMPATGNSMLSVKATSRPNQVIKALPEGTDQALRNGLVNAHLKLSDYYTKFDNSWYYLWALCKRFITSTRV
ncbi:hypothetical protein C8R43DRAFT_884009, partial [Mycena crocata]